MTRDWTRGVVAAAVLAVLVGTAEMVRSQAPGASGQSLAIANVTIIDTVSGALRPGMTVLVTGDRITGLEPAARVQLADNTQRVDGRGKFLIPGLWDMHFHWYETASLPLFVANGVTGARVMNGVPLHHQWRRDIEAGTLVGPRLVIGSRIIDGPKPVFALMTAVANAGEARQAVIKAKADGAEFIKIYQKLSREAFFAIAAESRRQGLPFVGHIPTSVTAVEVSDAGQRSIEHEQLLAGFSTREQDFDRAMDVAFAGTPERQPNQADWRPLFRVAVETFDRAKGKTLLARLRKNGTWVCPTVTMIRALAVAADPALRGDSRLRYVPAALRKEWMAFLDDPRTDEDLALNRRYYRVHLDAVRMMRDAGVGLLAGTDGGMPYSFPAFGIHDELRLLVEAGLTPLEALQAATLNPARFFGKQKDLGTVATGKLADLVLLDADPLADITNTTRIRAVIAGGRLFEMSDLKAILAAAEAAAQKK